METDLENFKKEIEDYEEQQKREVEFFRWLYNLEESERWQYRKLFGNRI